MPTPAELGIQAARQDAHDTEKCGCQPQDQVVEMPEGRVTIPQDCEDCGTSNARLRFIPGDCDGGFDGEDHERALCHDCAYSIGVDGPEFLAEYVTVNGLLTRRD